MNNTVWFTDRRIKREYIIVGVIRNEKKQALAYQLSRVGLARPINVAPHKLHKENPSFDFTTV